MDRRLAKVGRIPHHSPGPGAPPRGSGGTRDRGGAIGVEFYKITVAPFEQGEIGPHLSLKALVAKLDRFSRQRCSSPR